MLILHIKNMQTHIIEVPICRRLYMVTSMINLHLHILHLQSLQTMCVMICICIFFCIWTLQHILHMQSLHNYMLSISVKSCQLNQERHLCAINNSTVNTFIFFKRELSPLPCTWRPKNYIYINASFNILVLVNTCTL